MQYPELSKDELVLQQNVCDTKIRWKRRGDLIDSKGHVIPEEQDTSPEARITEHEYHEVYNSETKTLDFTKLRCTDVKNNPRVKLADPRPPIEEAHLTTRNSMVTQKFLKYVETHPHSQNLTPAEKRGIRKLRKRQSEGDLVIWLTDKSGKICVSGLDVYERCGDREVLGKDEKVDMSATIKAQKELVGHMRAMNHVLQTGIECFHVFSNYTSANYRWAANYKVQL